MSRQHAFDESRAHALIESRCHARGGGRLLTPYDFRILRVTPWLVKFECKIAIQDPQPIVRFQRSDDGGGTWTTDGAFTTVATTTYKLLQITDNASAIQPDTEYQFRWHLDDGTNMSGYVTQRTWPKRCFWVGYSDLGYCAECGDPVEGLDPWLGLSKWNGSDHGTALNAGYLLDGNDGLSEMEIARVGPFRDTSSDPNWKLSLECAGGAVIIQAEKGSTDILSPPTGEYTVTVDPCELIGVGGTVTIEASA